MQTRDQQRFTISEVAADWHRPNQLHQAIITALARTRLLLISSPAGDRRLSWPDHTVG